MTPIPPLRMLALLALVLAGPAWVFWPIVTKPHERELAGVPAELRERGRRFLSRLKNEIETSSYNRTAARGDLLLQGSARGMAKQSEQLTGLADLYRVRLQSRLESFRDEDTRDLMSLLSPFLDRLDEPSWHLLVMSGSRGMFDALEDPFARLDVGDTWSVMVDVVSAMHKDEIRKLPGGLLLVRPARFDFLAALNVANAAAQQGGHGIILDLRGVGGGERQDVRLLLAPFLPRGTVIATVIEPRFSPNSETITAGSTNAFGMRDNLPESAVGSLAAIPVVVLVDSTTGGGAELVAAALRRRRPPAPLIGAKTRGAPLFTHTFDLGVHPWRETDAASAPSSSFGFGSGSGSGSQSSLTLSVASFRLVDGTDLMGRGLNPDRRVDWTGTPTSDPSTDPVLAAGVRALLDLLDVDVTTIPEYRDLK